LQRRTRLGAERVELAVLRELRMERHEPEAAVQPRPERKVGGEGGRYSCGTPCSTRDIFPLRSGTKGARNRPEPHPGS
jgi:hypothetical protein